MGFRAKDKTTGAAIEATGKGYTLKFAVYPKGCGTNEKPVTVSCKVKIQKS